MVSAMRLVVALLVCAVAAPAWAQQDRQVDTVVDLELSRNGSGTAWQPATTPHAAIHGHAAGFELMFHESLFAGYDDQGSLRGAHELIGIGWVMGMARRRFKNSSLLLRAMLSPEAWTDGYRDGGYPLLLQTGETFDGAPIHDRQHAHDLFMELGALYTQGLTDGLGVQVYAAPSGEPALGPIAFPHRYSASSDPLATLSHHWQDSTHIAFGVLTAGVIFRSAKLEGSWFNGREPDEDRTDFDFHPFDSYAVRLSLAPAPAWTAQVSYGYLASPEALQPGVSVQRVTASAMYDHALGDAGHWAATAVFGANKDRGAALASSGLAEANVDLDGRDVVFGRVEVVQKTGGDLVLTAPLAETLFLLTSFDLGYLRNLGQLGAFLPGVGARGTLDLVPSGLEPFYGSRVLLGGIVFLRLAIAPMSHMHHMDGMDMGDM
jgi:hypothetical protein